MEECVLRKLVDTESDALEVVRSAMRRGFDEKKVLEYAQKIVQHEMIDKDTIFDEVNEWMANRPNFNADLADDENNGEIRDIFKNVLKIKPLAEYEATLTGDQQRAITTQKYKYFVTSPETRAQVNPT
jgi:hypothetical protein